VRDGLTSVDKWAKDAQKSLERRGITVSDEVANEAAELVKRFLVRGISK
jgi:hypothetical protein